MSYDNHPDSAGPQQTRLVGVYPEFSIAGLRVGVVTAVHYTDDDTNAVRRHVLYDVRDINTSELYKNARRSAQMSGFEDGDEDVLQAATKNHDATNTQPFKLTSRGIDTDGDVVLVGFINGVRSAAIILGVLPHSQMTYGAKKADGKRRISIHKGTTLERKEDGSVEMRRTVQASDGSEGAVTVLMSPTGRIEMTHFKGGTFIIDEDYIEIVGTKLRVDTSGVILGDNTGGVAVALAPLVMQVFQEIANWGTTHIHTDPLSVTTGPPTIPLVISGDVGSSNVKAKE